MTLSTTETRTINAFAHPRKVIPGCDHNRLYCKCDTPYWLRSSTPDESLVERRFYDQPVKAIE